MLACFVWFGFVLSCLTCLVCLSGCLSVHLVPLWFTQHGRFIVTNSTRNIYDVRRSLSSRTTAQAGGEDERPVEARAPRVVTTAASKSGEAFPDVHAVVVVRDRPTHHHVLLLLLLLLFLFFRPSSSSSSSSSSCCCHVLFFCLVCLVCLEGLSWGRSGVFTGECPRN